MKTIKFISGGQTGPDQAGIKVAAAHGYPTGGTACKRWTTEVGPAPWLANYGLVECDHIGYPPRTRKNVEDADITLIFDSLAPNLHLNNAPGLASRGTKLAIRTCHQYNKDFWVNPTAEGIVKYIRTNKPTVINIAGNRASKWAAGFEYVSGVLSDVFEMLDRIDNHAPPQ